MPIGSSLDLDVVILGGGVAGLWLLDELHRHEYRALLLEAFTLGHGQTISSQGIIHGGLKYTLSGLLTPSARAIRRMPLHWRRCLAGEQPPDLRGTRMRSEYCLLWQTDSLASRMGMAGARAGLHVAPRSLGADARPEPLRGCPGTVSRLDEQVIDPESFLTVLADLHQQRLLRIDPGSGLEFECSAPGTCTRVRLINPETGDPLDLAPRNIVLAAGAGNEALRTQLNLPANRTQRRPLHMVLARGSQPALNGHCVDGMKTRATITSARDYANRVVWQIGGQIAEDGVGMDAEALIAHAQSELAAILPVFDMPAMDWSTYRVDRAEPKMRGGRRPADVSIVREGTTITAWPTKLALAPVLAEQTRAALPAPSAGSSAELARNDTLRAWPRPTVAAPPWEETRTWHADSPTTSA